MSSYSVISCREVYAYGRCYQITLQTLLRVTRECYDLKSACWMGSLYGTVDGFKVVLAENVLVSSFPFSIEQVFIEPSSAVSNRKELLLKLMFTCLARDQNERLALGHDKTLSGMYSPNFFLLEW